MKIQLHWVGLIGFLVLVGLAGCGVGGGGGGRGAPADTTPPRVLSVYPEASATYVNPDTTISAIFDDALDSSSVTTSTFVLRNAANQGVSGGVSYYALYTCFTNGCGFQISFKPQGALAFGAQYTVTITQVRNTSGLSMTSAYTWSFTVIPAGVGTWQPTTTINAPSGRYGHTAVWTGSRMFVWGGTASNQNSLFNITASGGLYEPSTDAWQATAASGVPTARYNHTAIWTGADVIVWGGSDGTGNLATGGRYASITDSWRNVSTTNAPPATSGHTAVWTGNRMIVWGGDPYSNNGGSYEPVSDTWQSTSLVNAPLGRIGHTAVWTGSEMIVWGGSVPNGSGTVVRSNSGGRYNPVTDTWNSMSTLGAPESRESHTAIWTGSKMIVWGGYNTDYLGNGGIYDPGTDTWQAIPIADAPPARISHASVWTGSDMIVWGGAGIDGAYLNSGARFNPATSAWTTTSNINVPSPRRYQSAVWTGTQMIVWGGHEPVGVNTGTDTGGRYSP